MCAGQWEAIVVLLNLLHSNLPTADGVARLTVGTELPFVNIGVTVLAPLAHIAENRLQMALRAGHRRVHAP